MKSKLTKTKEKISNDIRRKASKKTLKTPNAMVSGFLYLAASLLFDLLYYFIEKGIKRIEKNMERKRRQK